MARNIIPCESKAEVQCTRKLVSEKDKEKQRQNRAVKCRVMEMFD